MASADDVVRVRDLRKDFGKGPVFDGIDLTVSEGEITLLMGPNGVGKTILLSCIAGGLRPDAGDVSVFGQSPIDARDDLSFMLQDAMLVDQLTGRENVSFFRALHPHSTGEWHDILDHLSFDLDALDRDVVDYSGGMRRKLELAIGLEVDVPLYLLDEPTGGLDMTTIDALHALLRERATDGATILLSSHLPVDAELADEVVVVTREGIVAAGDPDALLDAVPPVVRVAGLGGNVEQYVRRGRLFESDDGRRGFLGEEIEPEELESAVEGEVRVTDPTYTDLFNYYVHLGGETDE